MKTESECKFIAPPPSIRKGESDEHYLATTETKVG